MHIIVYQALDKKWHWQLIDRFDFGRIVDRSLTAEDFDSYEDCLFWLEDSRIAAFLTDRCDSEAS